MSKTNKVVLNLFSEPEETRFSVELPSESIWLKKLKQGTLYIKNGAFAKLFTMEEIKERFPEADYELVICKIRVDLHAQVPSYDVFRAHTFRGWLEGTVPIRLYTPNYDKALIRSRDEFLAIFPDTHFELSAVVKE